MGRRFCDPLLPHHTRTRDAPLRHRLGELAFTRHVDALHNSDSLRTARSSVRHGDHLWIARHLVHDRAGRRERTR